MEPFWQWKLTPVMGVAGGPAMFVYYYIHLDQPFETVERRLLGVLAGLDGIASAAYREGEILRTRLAVGGAAPPVVAKTVRISVGEPRVGGSETSVPLTWEATGTPGLFPKMEADILVAPLGPDLTQITFRGSYQPPLGPVGRALDRMILHRIAEASVKRLVDRIGFSIESDGHLEQQGTGREAN